MEQKDAYDTVIDLALKEYALSMDGVVKALRYDHIRDTFMAKVLYIDTRDNIQENIMPVTNEWVLDNYDKAVMKKLMDREENQQFLLPPTNQQGSLATVKINEDKVVRLKYVPEKKKEVEKTDGTMIEVIEHKWKAKLDSGQEANVTEDFVSANFGERFKNELK